MTALPDIDDAGVTQRGGESFLQTSSGKLISVQNPDPRDISIEDIAKSLSKQCRFNGHCSRFYSVGEHTILGDRLIQKLYPGNVDARKSWFVHDFTEAYVGDIIRPIKRHLPDFKAIENGYHTAINKAFNVNNYLADVVYTVDNLMVMWEKRDLLPAKIHWPGMPDINFLNLDPLPSLGIEETETLLKSRYKELFNVGS